jgi:transcriptional regulator with XRE-family HTH domain
VSGPNPTLRQREIGVRLRQHRLGQGLTVEEVAQQLLCSATKISRIETGARRASARDVRDLCRMYKLGSRDTDELMELAREARQPGWWAQYADLNLTPHIGLEDEAVSITTFSMYSVPALLQTAEYAEALLSVLAARLPLEAVNLRVEALLKRQLVLDRASPPVYRALLDESVLHRLVGGRAVMTGQLGKILELANGGQVTVQVIPFAAGAHGSADSNFELFVFDKAALPPVVFVEGLASDLYQERPTEISQYRAVVEYLRDTALSPRDSVRLINEIRNRELSIAARSVHPHHQEAR